MIVTLNKKKNASGTYSLYLQYNNKKEYLGLTLLKGKDKKDENEKTLLIAEQVRAMRQLELMQEAHNLKPQKKVPTFNAAWADFVKQKNSQGHNSVSVARNEKYKLVKKYIDELSPGITLFDFDIRWASKWIDWLAKDKGCKHNYVGALCNVVISFLHFVDDNELLHIEKKVFKALRLKEEELDIFFHDIEELKKMLHKDLSAKPNLEDTRDKYCLGCMLGMRISDLFDSLKILNQQNEDAFDSEGTLKVDIIKRTAIKTREAIKIPLRKEAKELIKKILSRSGGYRVVSEPIYNEEIKTVGELCEIDQNITMVHGKRKFKAGQTYKKYEVMSSHMARSTFICQMIEQDVHFQKIMAMTGIKDVNTLKKYASVMDNTLRETMLQVEFAQKL